MPYDFLVVAPGLVLDHDAIEGFSLDLVGTNGIGALYAGPQYAAKTWEAASKFVEDGGIGVFTRPATEMKCAGAPLKHTFLIEDIATRTTGARANTRCIMPPTIIPCSVCQSSRKKSVCCLMIEESTLTTVMCLKP